MSSKETSPKDGYRTNPWQDPEEAKLINALINNPAAQRERRASKDRRSSVSRELKEQKAPHIDPPPAKASRRSSALDVSVPSSRSSKPPSRETRVSKDAVPDPSSQSGQDNSTSRRSHKADASADVKMEPVAQLSASAGAHLSMDAKQSTDAKRRWKDAALALQVQSMLGDLADEEAYPGGQAKQKATPEQLRLNTEKLKGAAARGARAAALKSVQSAAQHVGGILLTQEQWDAHRAEVALLKASLKRVQGELDQTRASLREARYEDDSAAPNGSLIAGAGQMIANAWAAISPGGRRPNSEVPVVVGGGGRQGRGDTEEMGEAGVAGGEEEPSGPGLLRPPASSSGATSGSGSSTLHEPATSPSLTPGHHLW